MIVRKVSDHGWLKGALGGGFLFCAAITIADVRWFGVDRGTGVPWITLLTFVLSCLGGEVAVWWHKREADDREGRKRLHEQTADRTRLEIEELHELQTRVAERSTGITPPSGLIPPERRQRIERDAARAGIVRPGEALQWREDGRPQIVPLSEMVAYSSYHSCIHAWRTEHDTEHMHWRRYCPHCLTSMISASTINPEATLWLVTRMNGVEVSPPQRLDEYRNLRDDLMPSVQPVATGPTIQLLTGRRPVRFDDK